MVSELHFKMLQQLQYYNVVQSNVDTCKQQITYNLSMSVTCVSFQILKNCLKDFGILKGYIQYIINILHCFQNFIFCECHYICHLFILMAKYKIKRQLHIYFSFTFVQFLDVIELVLIINMPSLQCLSLIDIMQPNSTTKTIIYVYRLYL